MTRKTPVAAVTIAVALALTGCAGVPAPPPTVAADYPGVGIPTSVAWASDWLSGIAAETDGIGDPIVGLRLEYGHDGWMWRVRSVDPGRDLLGERRDDPTRGREAILDAATLRTIAHHDITLTGAEQADLDISAYDAAKLSGEVYPSPRLVELERRIVDGRPMWRITTYDTTTGALSVTNSGGATHDNG